MLTNDRDAKPAADAVAAPAPPPVPADYRADASSRSGPVLDAITAAAGLLCAAIGVTVLVAWFARATVILRFGSSTPMSANTALAVVLSGAGLVAVTWRRPRAALLAGVFDVALGATLLAEYAPGRRLGIDQLILHPYLSQPHGASGRLAVNTTVCVMLAGATLLVWGPWRSRPRRTAPAVGGSLIAAITVIAFGYVTGTPAAYGWGRLSALSLGATSAMLFLALSLLSAAWRDTTVRHGMLPRWLPLPPGVLALGLVGGVWLAVAGRGQTAERITAGTVTGAATVLGLVLAGLVMLVVCLAQRADGRRQVAVAEAARRAGAKLAAREGEQRLFQFLDVMPVAVFVTLPGGQPYYANAEFERLLGRGIVTDVSAAQLAQTYKSFQSGTDRPYPTERMAIVRALRGEPSHLDDMEIRKPDEAVIPLEVWGRPVYGAGGDVDYALAAFADMSERAARERIITGQVALLELVHDAIFVRDLDGRITYWNDGAERTYGFTQAEAMGRVSRDLLSTEFPEPLASIEAAVAQHGLWEGELA